MNSSTLAIELIKIFGNASVGTSANLFLTLAMFATCSLSDNSDVLNLKYAKLL